MTGGGRRLALVFLLASALLPAGATAAPLYRWVDEQGQTHVTDDPNAVPEPCRSPTLSPASPPGTSEGGAASLDARRAAADRYLAVVPLDGIITSSIEQLARRMPEARRQRFLDLTTRLFRKDWINGVARESLAKHFTVQEMDGLARFYGSPEGQSIMKKFGTYMADVLPAIQQEVLRAVRESERSMEGQ